MGTTPNATTSLVQIIQQRPELQQPKNLQLIFKQIFDYKKAFEAHAVETDTNTALVEMLAYSESLLISEIDKAEFKISCRKGCAHCCKQKVDISSVEAQLIVDFCKEENIQINVDYLRKQAQLDETNWIGNESAACSFLGKDNACTVYEVRPMACRKYLVMTEPDLCDTVKYPKGTVGAFGSLDVEIVASMLANIDQDMKTLAQRILMVLDKQEKQND